MMVGCGETSSSSDSTANYEVKKYALEDYTKVSDSADLEGIWVGVLETEALSSDSTVTVNISTRILFNVFSTASSDGEEEELYFTSCHGSTTELHLGSDIIDTQVHRVVNVQNNNVLLLKDILGNDWTAIKVSNSAKSLGGASYSWANSSKENSSEQILAACFQHVDAKNDAGAQYSEYQSYLFTYADLESSKDQYDYTVINPKVSLRDSRDLHINYGHRSEFEDLSFYSDDSDTVILSDSVNEAQKYSANFTGSSATTGESVDIAIDLEL